MSSMVSSRSLVLIAAMGVLAACSHGDEDEQKAEAPGVLDIVGVAVEGTWNRHAGSDRADDELLADIVALAEDPELAGDAADDAAIAAAETGHLVFGTLHTSSAAKTIDRIIDVFPADEKEMVRAMLSESLQAVISQTLCKTKDGQGRVAAHEIMIGTPAIRNLIREAKVAQMYSAIQTGQSVGMQTLDQNLTDLVKRNIISVGEARSKAKIPENFAG